MSGETIGWNAADIITIAVPPALLVCLTLTTACMLLRLKRLGITVTVRVPTCMRAGLAMPVMGHSEPCLKFSSDSEP